ncbi:PadR family transcriptional regulator [Ekhidna sp.]
MSDFLKADIHLEKIEAPRLGPTEELILLSILILDDNAYLTEIRRDMDKRLKNGPSDGHLKNSLMRMESKGFLVSFWTQAIPKRGGRRKKIYKATMLAYKVIKDLERVRLNFRRDINFERYPELK